MYQSNTTMPFKVVDTEKKPKPVLKAVESEKAVRLRKNVEIMEQALYGENFDHELVKDYSGLGGLYAEIKERESELVWRVGKDRYLNLLESTTSGYYTPSKWVLAMSMILCAQWALTAAVS